MNTLLLFLLLSYPDPEIQLTSSQFANGGEIPARYTCEGQNINPPLSISGVPRAAVSLVLVVDDPDADRGVFDHWIVWNISPTTREIGEDSKPTTEGRNGGGGIGYTGPCPPEGSHHYHFIIYALDRRLEIKSGAVKKDVLNAIDGHILASGELIGTYHKQQQ